MREGKERAVRLNKGCTQVMHALEGAGKLCSAQDIYMWLRNNSDESPALTTIYRSLETLLSLNLIQSVDLGDGEKHYETVAPGEHHHHLICTSCRNSVHLDQCFIETFSDKVEQRHGFKVRTHILEIFGLCGKCLLTEKHSSL
jgi:Fur family ferric uptake transcriptional regulator